MAALLIVLYLLAGSGTMALFCYINRRESYLDVSLLAVAFVFWFLVLLVILAENLEGFPTVRNPFWKRSTP